MVGHGPQLGACSADVAAELEDGRQGFVARLERSAAVAVEPQSLPAGPAAGELDPLQCKGSASLDDEVDRPRGVSAAGQHQRARRCIPDPAAQDLDVPAQRRESDRGVADRRYDAAADAVVLERVGVASLNEREPLLGCLQERVVFQLLREHAHRAGPEARVLERDAPEAVDVRAPRRLLEVEQAHVPRDRVQRARDGVLVPELVVHAAHVVRVADDEQVREQARELVLVDPAVEALARGRRRVVQVGEEVPEQLRAERAGPVVVRGAVPDVRVAEHLARQVLEVVAALRRVGAEHVARHAQVAAQEALVDRLHEAVQAIEAVVQVHRHDLLLGREQAEVLRERRREVLRQHVLHAEGHGAEALVEGPRLRFQREGLLLRGPVRAAVAAEAQLGVDQLAVIIDPDVDPLAPVLADIAVDAVELVTIDVEPQLRHVIALGIHARLELGERRRVERRSHTIPAELAHACLRRPPVVVLACVGVVADGSEEQPRAEQHRRQREEQHVAQRDAAPPRRLGGCGGAHGVHPSSTRRDQTSSAAASATSA